MSNISSGLLMYRIKDGKPEVFLVHPGGPFYKNKDVGVWSMPKGRVDDGEDIFLAAQREFKEETSFEPQAPFIELGTAERPGRIYYAWAFLGDRDPALMKSNTCTVEWPPKSGKQMEIPECDRGEYFTIEEAKIKISVGQAPLLDAFQNLVT